MSHLTDDRMTLPQIAVTVLRLSIPAILAEISSIVMQYIDAAMVGSLGEQATAAIGLVSTSTWLIGGLCISSAMGFSVQTAQLIGAGREEDARSVFRQSLLCVSVFGLLLAAIAACISGALPGWLGGETGIRREASAYFLIYACALPLEQLRMLSGSMLQCSGDMKTPSILNTLLCGFDVVFNFLLIFPTRTVELLGNAVTLPGAGLGVEGAALGTALSEVCTAGLMLYAACFRSEKLSFRLGGSWRLQRETLVRALKIALPTAFEHTATCGAYVAATRITAPLGKVSLAANSLAVTAESFCYMPGYGIGSAATTLIGQSIGAGKNRLAKRFSYTAVALGMLLMSASAVVMYLTAPVLFALLTPSEAVRELGVRVLRLEAFAEPLYAASIVSAGALRGAGDTLVPSVFNLVSMWGVRITLSVIFAARLGLYGIWLAMCIELCFRGTLFLIRLLRGKWVEHGVKV